MSYNSGRQPRRQQGHQQPPMANQSGPGSPPNEEQGSSSQFRRRSPVRQQPPYLPRQGDISPESSVSNSNQIYSAGSGNSGRSRSRPPVLPSPIPAAYSQPVQNQRYEPQQQTRQQQRFEPNQFGQPLNFPGQPSQPLLHSAKSDVSIQGKKTVRRIPLTKQGNLVIDVPVADRVALMGRYNKGDEFTHLRYTAVTCTPDEFQYKGYNLRQQELARSTEIFIVVTMYNENDHLFCKSMQALMKNIAYLCTRTKSKTWGTEGWKKVLVCIVSDGRSKCNTRVLDVLGIMGVFQTGIMKDHVNGTPVTAHLFEYTTQVCVTHDLKVQGHENGYVPIQILFCLKEKNAKKINSHRWFFNAFGPLIRPNVCILIDVGTKPTTHSLYHLYKAFENNSSVGGACGEIYAELGSGCSNLINPLVAAQNFEYKMSNILDKPLESVCGYISVLPGAFSAYRYKALLGMPLEQYFKGETLHGSEDIFAANMYLAEDRILCFEIVTKSEEAWLLKYVKSAQAETDVPDSTPEFISQRRRWLNGSFFASVHALTHWYLIFRSKHNVLRKSLLCFEFLYNFVNLFFNWFNVSFFYLTFFFLVGGIADSPDNDPFKINGTSYGSVTFSIFNNFYIMVVIMIFISSLGNRPQGSKGIFNLSIFLFACIMALMMFITGYSIKNTVQAISSDQYRDFINLLKTNPTFRDVILSSAATFGLYFISSLLYLDPWHMFTSFIQYLLFLPSFSNILTVYSFCNLHDVSWGTKGDNAAAALGGVTAQTVDGKETVEVELLTDLKDINNNYEKFIRRLAQPRPIENTKRDAKTKTEDYYKTFRTRVVLAWVFSNALMIIVITNEALLGDIRKFFLVTKVEPGGVIPGNPFLQFIFWSVFVLSTIRFTGSTWYLVKNTLAG